MEPRHATASRRRLAETGSHGEGHYSLADPEIRTWQGATTKAALPNYRESSFPEEMPANSNFQQAIQSAQRSALVGPNVLKKALPFVGGGMVLTAGGVMGGLALMASNPALFMPLFYVALIGNLILFFVAQKIGRAHV